MYCAVTNQILYPVDFTTNDEGKGEIANELYETKEKLTHAIFKFMEELNAAEK